MLKKTITFKDLDDNTVTEDFYFHLNKGELAEMQVIAEGGMAGMLQEIIASGDNERIIQHFKDIIAKAYGVRGEDGRRFIKSKELSDAFMQTDAYSELFVELMTDAKGAAEFITAIVPADIALSAAEADALVAEAMGQDLELPAEPVKKLSDMTKEELVAAMEARIEAKKAAQPEG